jgi:hypothetical protein
MKTILFGLLLVAGCATIPRTEQVQIRAAHDLRCAQVTATPVDASTMKATGCGQEVVYREECVSADTTRCTWVAQGGATRNTASQTP